MSYSPPDWINKSLSELSLSEWEQLCDGCGKCCMAKLQDEETNKIYYTNVACELFDINTCRCQDYAHRSDKVPDCLTLSLDRAHEFDWLPITCAYRLRANNQVLPAWHPLMTGKTSSTHDAGVSVKHKAVSIEQAGDLEHHLVEWDSIDSLT